MDRKASVVTKKLKVHFLRCLPNMIILQQLIVGMEIIPECHKKAQKAQKFRKSILCFCAYLRLKTIALRGRCRWGFRDRRQIRETSRRSRGTSGRQRRGGRSDRWEECGRECHVR